MTSVGFGNVAAETDNERIFTICMMIIAGTINTQYNSLINVILEFRNCFEKIEIRESSLTYKIC